MMVKRKIKNRLISVITLIVVMSSIMFSGATVFADAAPAGQDGITITTTLEDNVIQKGSKKTIDVIAKLGGQKVESQVFLNDEPVAVNWSDSTKDSYTLKFTEEGKNIVRIVGKSGDKTAEITRTVNYVKAAEGELIGYATFSLEA